MSPQAREAHSANATSKRLLALALKDLLKEREYPDVSVSDIVTRCGVARRTFYNHFKDKEDLVAWIYETEVLSRLRVPARDTWADNIYDSIHDMYEDRDFYTKVFSAADPATHWGHRMEFAVYAFCSVIERYLDGRSLPAATEKYIAQFYAIGYVNTLLTWVQNGMKETPEYLTQRLVDMVDNGIYYAVDHAGDLYKG